MIATYHHCCLLLSLDCHLTNTFLLFLHRDELIAMSLGKVMHESENRRERVQIEMGQLLASELMVIIWQTACYAAEL
jgi:hypothetical protein